MKEGAFIPPVHWDDNIFLQMVEPALTTELERHLWARLSQAVRYEEVFEMDDYSTYTAEDMESTLKERDNEIGELKVELERMGEDYARECVANEELECKVKELEDQIDELKQEIVDLYYDKHDLERRLNRALGNPED